MYKHKIPIAFILMLGLLEVGCGKPKIWRQVKGSWTIDSILYNGEDISRFYFSTSFLFMSDQTCWVPTSDLSRRPRCRWDLGEQDDDPYLIFKSDEKLFNGNFTITFLDTLQPGNVPIMSLRLIAPAGIEQDKIEFICRKSFLL